MKRVFFVIALFFFIRCSGQGLTLDYFLMQAELNSPVIKDYQNQILSNRIDSQILRATLQTQVNFISTNSYAPVIKGYGYDPAITNIANVSGLVQANRNFFTKENIRAQYLTITLQGRAFLDTIELSRRELSRAISEQYITAYGDLLALDFTKEVFDLMKQEEAVLKKLTQQSVYKQTDYLNFFVTMQQQELSYLQAQALYNTDFLTLNYLSGIVDTTVRRIVMPEFQNYTEKDPYNTIFYNRFATDSMRLANERRLIDFQYKPKIGAYTDAGYNSSLQYLPYRNFGFSVGLSLTVPIYDGRQRQMKYAKVDIEERTRQNNRTFFMSQYRQQLAQLRMQLQSIEELVGKIEQQIIYSRTLVVANNKLLETGDITMRDYVTSINNYLNAQNFRTQNNISRLKILNQISYWNR